MNLTILLFNNRIYGLTKGQYSPTSEVGKVTKSTPMGSLDHPFNPVSLALGADATFVGRAMDSDRKGLTDVLRQAAEHQGTALVEIYQNCNIFNDGAFELLKDPATGTQWSIPLVHGKPLVFGPDGASCVVQDDFGGLRIAETNQVDAVGDRRPRRAPGEPRLRVRAVPAVQPGPALHADGRLPVGPEADLRRDDGRAARRRPHRAPRDLDALLVGNDTWTVITCAGRHAARTARDPPRTAAEPSPALSGPARGLRAPLGGDV